MGIGLFHDMKVELTFRTHKSYDASDGISLVLLNGECNKYDIDRIAPNFFAKS